MSSPLNTGKDFSNIKWATIKRANWQCEICGKNWQQSNKKLTAHHITYNSHESICICVCPECHVKITKYHDLLKANDVKLVKPAHRAV